MTVQIAANSAHTLRRGSLSPARVAQVAKEKGHRVAVLAERDFTVGWPEFVRSCAEVGVAPVLGLWTREGPSRAGMPGSWLYLACGEEAARRMMVCSGRMWLDERRRAREVHDALEDADVVRIAVDPEAWLGSRRVDAVGAWGPEDTEAVRAADVLDRPALAVRPWCMEGADEDAQALVRAYAEGLTWEGGLHMEGAPWWALDAEELEEAFAAEPALLRNAEAVCAEAWGAVVSRQTQARLADDEELLRRTAGLGLELRLRERGLEQAQGYRERLEHELRIIAELGYAEVFLLVGEWMSAMKRDGCAVGPGRGSACASITAWALGITEEDPIAERLLFTRFLNPARVSPPDFDVDVERSRHHTEQERLRRMWEERVGAPGVHAIGMSVWQGVKRRAAFRFACKARGIPHPVIESVAGTIPPTMDRGPDTSELSPGDRARIGWAWGASTALEGAYGAVSQHPGGVAIGREDFAAGWPRVWPEAPDVDGGAGVLQTDAVQTEKLGAIKVDVLSSEVLSVVAAMWRAGVAEGRWRLAEEPAVYAKLRAGHTAGVFQLEKGMAGAAKDLAISGFDELRALIALYRPGPIAQLPSYSRRARGEESPDPPAECLRAVLAETYGIIVYQEQVMAVAQEIAGFGESEADELRRAVGKKKPEEMAARRSEFLAGGMARGRTKEELVKVWELLEAHAHYSFNRAHATAYGRIAYATAWYAWNRPEVFYAACCQRSLAVADTAPLLRRYVRIAAAHGIRAEAPLLSLRNAEFRTVEREGVPRMVAPLETIDGVGEKQAERLRAVQWPKSAAAACRRLYEVAGREGGERVVACGALRDLAGGRRWSALWGHWRDACGGERGGEGPWWPMPWEPCEALSWPPSKAREVLGAVEVASWEEGGVEQAELVGVVVDARPAERMLELADETGVAALRTTGRPEEAPEPGSAVLLSASRRSGEAVVMGWRELRAKGRDVLRVLRLRADPMPAGGGRVLEAVLDAYRPGPCPVRLGTNGEWRRLDPVAAREGLLDALAMALPEVRTEWLEADVDG